MTTTLNAYLTLDGKCEQALKFWADVLGASLDIKRMGDGPMECPPEHKNRVMHGVLKTGDLVLMASDCMPGQAPTMSGAISLCLNFSDKAEQTRVWERLIEGGQITMPLEEQFWGRFGMLKDRFGVDWMLNQQPKTQG